MTEKWAQLQGLCNDFDATMQRNFSESDQKCCEDHGTTTACTLWMAKATVSSNHAHKDTLRQFVVCKHQNCDCTQQRT